MAPKPPPQTPRLTRMILPGLPERECQKDGITACWPETQVFISYAKPIPLCRTHRPVPMKHLSPNPARNTPIGECA